MTTGHQLRSAREHRGLSIEDVARETHVPERYLDALEKDRPDLLPDGPYRTGYLRLYQGFLGFPGAPAEVGSSEEAERASSGGWMVAGAVLAALVVLGAAAALSAGPPGVAAVGADQQVRVEMLRAGHLTVIVDGVVEHDRYLEGGSVVEVAGHDRVVVEVPAIDRTRVTWNGKRVVPQGVQDQPRRLIFVDDGLGG